MPPDHDQHFMRQAIRLAMNGRGKVEPNPMVGCVIVKNGHIIGQGHHEKFGEPHAEPNALANCKESPHGATAYVTLEPCCHTNKKTPPCVPQLIQAKLARVVIGCHDPNPNVNGQGTSQLRAAGIQVDTPLLEPECQQLIAPFIANTIRHRPYVTLKWAETADGKVAGPGGKRLQISNEHSMRIVHALRARCDAILVGVNTAIIDDPLLTTRGIESARPLLRAVVDSELRLPPYSKLATSAKQSPLIDYTSDHAVQEELNRMDDLVAVGVQIVALPVSDDDLPVLECVLSDLHQRGSAHLLVEPGPTLAASFFRDNLCDRLWVFRSPNRVNDDNALSAAPIPSHFIQTGQLNLEGDTLTEYLNPRSPVFFANEPSADFILAST